MTELAHKTLWLIPLLPLAGFLINGLVGRRLPNTVIGLVGCLMPAGAFALSVVAVLALRESHAPVVQQLGDWIRVANVSIPITLRVDTLSALMILVVTGVGTLIHIYSIGYMHGDEGFARFFAYLNLFMFAMLVLVLGDSLLLMFVGWEGVGLCSYLLIGFWYEDLKNADAGKKAFITNRIGDFGFILGALFLWSLTGTLSPSEMQSKLGGISPALLAAPALLLFLGATGKSAQIPLYVWLPDAMAGPTPVSALIHAATMVTAGVYMIGRMHFLYVVVPGAMETIVLVGAATALLAGVIAIAQNDIKKVLAYSTISQLGFMFAGMASAHFTTGVFHLATHAFFKALLFLGAGAIIHSLHGEQDMRNMGGLRKSLPVTFIFFLCGAAALMGFPLTSGFFSKDLILAGVGSRDSGAFSVAWLMLVATAGITAFYTTRMLVMVFFGDPKDPERHPHAPGLMMTIPLAILALLSLGGGAWLEYGLHIDRLFASTWGEPEGAAWAAAKSRSLATSVFVMAVGALAAGLLFTGSRREWVRSFVEGEMGRGIYKLVVNKFYIDELYHVLIVAPLKMGAAVLWFVVDRILVDAVLVNGTARAAYAAGGIVRRAHTGSIAAGAGAILVGVLAVAGWLVYRFVLHG